MIAERVPKPLNGRGGIVAVHFSTAITLVPLIKESQFFL